MVKDRMDKVNSIISGERLQEERIRANPAYGEIYSQHRNSSHFHSNQPPLRIDQSSDRECNRGKSRQREQLKNKRSINLNNAGRRITTPDATLAIFHRHILQCRQTPSPQTAQTTLDPSFTCSSAASMPCWKIIMRDHKHPRIVVFTHKHPRHPLVPIWRRPWTWKHIKEEKKKKKKKKKKKNSKSKQTTIKAKGEEIER